MFQIIVNLIVAVFVNDLIRYQWDVLDDVIEISLQMYRVEKFPEQVPFSFHWTTISTFKKLNNTLPLTFKMFFKNYRIIHKNPQRI